MEEYLLKLVLLCSRKVGGKGWLRPALFLPATRTSLAEGFRLQSPPFCAPKLAGKAYGFPGISGGMMLRIETQRNICMFFSNQPGDRDMTGSNSRLEIIVWGTWGNNVTAY